MVIAYIACKRLSAVARAKIDELVRANPMCETCGADVASGRRELNPFLRAATWADLIKTYPVIGRARRRQTGRGAGAGARSDNKDCIYYRREGGVL